MPVQPLRGEIWLADLDPIRGHEQAGKRPVLVVSTNGFNQGPADMIIIVPLTSTGRRIPYRVQMDPPNGGLKTTSYVLCDSVRAIAKERLIVRWGTAPDEVLEQVEDYLRILLEL